MFSHFSVCFEEGRTSVKDALGSWNITSGCPCLPEHTTLSVDWGLRNPKTTQACPSGEPHYVYAMLIHLDISAQQAAKWQTSQIRGNQKHWTLLFEKDLKPISHSVNISRSHDNLGIVGAAGTWTATSSLLGFPSIMFNIWVAWGASSSSVFQAFSHLLKSWKLKSNQACQLFKAQQLRMQL